VNERYPFTNRNDLAAIVSKYRYLNYKIVLTTGCYDLLHVGHLSLLQTCRNLSPLVIVGLNSDSSVNRLKGKERPLVPELERGRMLMALEPVFQVTLIEEDTPEELIRVVQPHFYVKGGDYTVDTLPEGSTVTKYGGEIVLAPHIGGRSTTELVGRLRGLSEKEGKGG